MSLSAAKNCTDRVLDGARVTIPIEHQVAAEDLARRLNDLGAVARVLDPDAEV
jgi:hypothetical protein